MCQYNDDYDLGYGPNYCPEDPGYPDDHDYPPEYDRDPCDEEGLIDGVGFADPNGRSSLRAETERNPRDQPCPTCGAENVLTRIDVARHYQCNNCADRAEGRFGRYEY